MAKNLKIPKSDNWAFLEEIDAPQWVDLTSEAASNAEERDDSWFYTVHPFHLQSFHELVSPVVLKKAKVSNSVRLYPGLINSVSKSRGCKPFPRNKVSEFRLLEVKNAESRRTRRLSGRKPATFKSKGNVKTGANACLHKPSNEATTKSCLRIPSKGNELVNPTYAQFQSSAVQDSKNQSASACLQISTVGNKLENPIHVQVRSSTVCDPCEENQFTNVVDIQGKSSTSDPENQLSTACLETSAKENEFGYSIYIQTMSSAAGDNNNQSNKACLQVPSKGNESKNLIDLPTVADTNYLSMSTEFRSVVPKASGLITMLKAASLRRSCGVLPMRVEVKDGQGPKDRKSCSNKVSIGSSHDTNRKTSSLGSTGNNSQQVKKEDTLKKLKNQTEISTMPSNKHNWNKSSIGFSTTLEEKVKNRYRTSVEYSRKKSSTGSSNIPEGSNDTAMKYNKLGQALKEAGRKQGQPGGKDSGKLGRNHGQPSRDRKFGAELSMRGKTQASRQPLKNITNAGLSQHKSAELSMRGETQASRQPLKNITNAGLSQHKSDILQNQRFSRIENNQLGTTLQQKINQTEIKKPLASTKENFADQVELKVHAQPKAQSALHSMKDIKQWEKNSGRSYYSLSRMEKEKANREIQICKSLSR